GRESDDPGGRPAGGRQGGGLHSGKAYAPPPGGRRSGTDPGRGRGPVGAPDRPSTVGLNRPRAPPTQSATGTADSVGHGHRRLSRPRAPPLGPPRRRPAPRRGPSSASATPARRAARRR